MTTNHTDVVATVVKEVVPYDIPANLHRKLFSVLKSVPYDHAEKESKGHRAITTTTTTAHAKVPVLNEVDVNDIVQANTLKIFTEGSTKRTSSSETGDGEAVNGNATVDLTEQPRKYTSVEALIPKNLKDQLDTIIITHFPNVKLIAAEKILQILMGSGRGDYVWSNLNYDYIDNKMLFVKFDSVEDVKWFITKYEKDLGSLLINKEIMIVHHHELSNYGLESGPLSDDIDDDNARVMLNSLLLNVKNYEKVSAKTGTEDLDEVMDYYSRYKVDNNELIDVPSHMKEVIVKDIIKFRSEVLNIEREMRKKEIEIERKQTKERLKKIYEGIKETNEDSTKRSASEVPEESVKAVNEYPGMSDKAYDAFIESEEKSQLDKNYRLKLIQMQVSEAVERRELESTLQKLKSYEQDLINSKTRLFEDIKQAAEFKDQTRISQFSAVLKAYTDDRVAYLAERGKKRSAEELQDKNDGDGDADVDVEVEVEPDVAKAESEATSEKVLAVDEPMREDSVVVIANLSSEETEKVNAKIKNLVEEYLGEIDELLVDIIIDHLTKHNLDAKQQLVTDLFEVLDEDAENLTNDLWEYIETEFPKQ